MEHNGHDFIDILKIDIEGAEFASLATFFDFYESQPRPLYSSESPMDFTSTGGRYDFVGKPLPIGQLQIELHPRESEESEPFFREKLYFTEMISQSPGISPISLLSLPGGRRWNTSDFDPSGLNQTWFTSTSLVPRGQILARFVEASVPVVDWVITSH